MKIAIVGGPCSGKSTLIAEFKKRKYPVLEEIARNVLEDRKSFSINQNETLIRQRLILEKQHKEELKFEHTSQDYAFLDRGIADVIGYCNHLLGHVPEFAYDYNLIKRYEVVFLLGRLKFENDGLRIEKGERESKIVHEHIINAYKDCDYHIIEVPVMPLEERANFILNYLNQLKGGRIR